jgi:hypothetical protein
VKASISIRSFNFYPYSYSPYCSPLILYVCFRRRRRRCVTSAHVNSFSSMESCCLVTIDSNTTIISLPRRITCRKGKVQGCQRRTRHDIERIVGLLNQSLLSVALTTMSCSLSSNFSSCSLSFVSDSFYRLDVKVYVRSRK